MFQSLISKFLLKNEKTGLPSYSLTMTCIAFIVINIKLVFSGFEMGHFLKFSDFSGVDYGAALAALSALHVGNKAVVNKGNSNGGN
jgi:hypothetical protein